MTAPNRFLLPARAGKVLSFLPPYPGSFLFTTALNLVLAEALPADVKHALEGRTLRIAVSDARIAFDFCCRQERFHPCRPNGAPDLTICASAQDLLLLAQRKEDPDTLFFSRRLTMEGDTELGLLVKNALDALELPAFELARLAPARIFGKRTAR